MSLSAALDVNVDMGESFGRWQLGDDVGIMPFISSVSIACGFHAGDPGTIRRTVSSAVNHGLQIGAHVALPDLLGFGRRRMVVAASDLRDYVLYQVGAIKAFVEAEGSVLGHVKPHGALYAMCSADPELAGAVAEATAEVDRDLLLLLLTEQTRDAVERHGIRLVTEAFPDLNYNPDGSLIIEGVKQAWGPDKVAARALRVAQEGRIDAADGSELVVSARSVCIHGDSPNAVEVARAVRQRLDEARVDVLALREIVEREPQPGAQLR